MKKHIYIALFILLGIICCLFIFGIVDVFLINHGISLNEPLYLAILLVGGAVAGYWEGKRWWQIIYVEKAYLHWKKDSWKWKCRFFGTLLIFTIAIILFIRNYIHVSNDNYYELTPQHMIIESSAFAPNSAIPAKYTCDGEKINPPLSFSEIPAGTKTLALIVEDPDVPRTLRPDGMFDHWVVWNIPPTTKEIPENTKAPGVTGLNGMGSMQYVPPCPPDREHRYFFKLYALDEQLQIPPTSSKKDLLQAMEGHVIDTAELVGKYNRKK